MRARSPTGRVVRIGRAPDPWAWPDWAEAAADGTFGNRWDDPQSEYRVLYASSTRLGAFVEVLARFRPDPHVAAELAAIDGEERGALPPGRVPASWLGSRLLGDGALRGSFADVGQGESLQEIRQELASRLVHYNISDLDGAAIRLSLPRRLTQEISRFVYEQTTPQDERAFAGITYLSRLGDEFRNWAVFEPADPEEARRVPEDAAVSRISAEDPDLRRALELLGLELVVESKGGRHAPGS